MTLSLNSKTPEEAKLELIGLGFQVGVGKDSAADELCSRYGFVCMRFADALKEAVAAIFGWSKIDLEKQEFKAAEDAFWGITPRVALQVVGTEAMRNNVRKDIWIKALQLRIMKRLQRMHGTGHAAKVVITDMRFMNEVEAIKEWGGKVVKVERPVNPFTPAGTAATHASEIDLVGYTAWDHILVNDGTLGDLACKAGQMYHALFKPV